MIKDIKEINFPPYATLSQATCVLQDMGDKSITTQIKIDGNITPDFSKDWEIEFKGERYIMPLRQPQSAKDNTSLNSVIDLTFQHWAIYQLKRYYFVTMQPIDSGTAVADKYIASVSLNLKGLCDLFKQILQYYYGDAITIDFNSEWKYVVEPTVIDISYSYVWDVLIKIYDLFAVRWEIVPAEDNSKYVIKIGYNAIQADHIFQYGFEGGLLKVERQVQDDNIRNIILGRGGEKNLPYRYFKAQDPDNDSFASDPDWIPELANIYFSNLHDATFRSYVQGWRAKHYSGLATKTEAYAPWAWEKGYTDKKFNPIEYVKDDASIAKYGELWGGLDNNEDIYPSIQGIEVDPYGRVDQIVSVDEILSDETIDEEPSSYKLDFSKLDNIITVHQDTIPAYKTVQVTSNLSPNTFVVPEGYHANIQIGDINKIVRAHGTNEDYEIYAIITGNIKVFDEAGKEYLPVGIPAGTYRYKTIYNIENTTSKTIRVTLTNDKTWADVSNINGYRDGEVFNIWVKNIWGSQRLAEENDLQYAERVWAPILGDRIGNEAMVVFASGLLSLSEDYQFVIAETPKYDTSKTFIEKDSDNNTIGTYTSYWRITLRKSDAEFDATGLLLPNTKINAHAGDYFFFTGIDMPHQYVVWAEERLSEYKKDELAKVSDIKPTWVVSIDKVRAVNKLEDEADQLINQLVIGSSFRLADKRFIQGSYETLYVQSLTYTYNQQSGNESSIIPNIEIVLSNDYTTVASPVATLQGEVSSLRKQIGSSLSNIAQTVRNIGDNSYLRKSGIPDISNSPTTFHKQVVFGDSVLSRDYRQGEFLGTGWRLGRDENGDSTIELDNAIIRKKAIFNETVINQISFSLGTTVFSNGGFECTNVQEMDHAYRCYYDNKDGKRYSGIIVDDQVRCQRYSNAQDSITKYYWMLVVAVGDNYVDLSKSDRDGTGIPEVGDNIVQMGNRTDAQRQRAIVIDPLNGTVEVYAHISSYTLTERNFAGMGVNPQTGDAYMYGYGDLFFGDRDLSDALSQYITFQKRQGDTRRKMHINATIHMGADSTGLSNLSEWAQAQTQIDNAQIAADNANQNAEAIKNFTDVDFAAGISGRAEAAAIEKYLNSIEETCKSVDAAYTEIYANKLLTGTAKSDLQMAKNDFDSAATNLLSAITTAIQDGIVSHSEKVSVDTLYGIYNSAYETFITRFEAAQKYIQTAINTTAQGAYQLSQELRQTVDTINETIIPDLQLQIDGSIISYSGDDVPTLSNYPANEWATDAERDRHIGDYFDRKIVNDEGDVSYERYKFIHDVVGGSSYQWIRISDSGAAEAIAAAREALGVAGSKAKVFLGNTTPSVPYSVNDLWIKDDGTIYGSNANKGIGATSLDTDWQLLNEASLRLRQISADNVISKEEKVALRDEYAQIQVEYNKYLEDANTHGASKTALQDAYNTLSAFLAGTVAIASDTDTTLTASQKILYNNYFANYYAEANRICNAIAEKIAQTNVNNIKIGGGNLINGTNQGTKHWIVYLQTTDNWSKDETMFLGVRGVKISTQEAISTSYISKLLLFGEIGHNDDVYMYDALREGDDVVVSMDVDSTNIKGVNMQMCYSNGARSMVNFYPTYISIAADGVAHLEWHGVVTENVGLKEASIYCHIYPTQNGIPISITIANLKLEKGTKGSSWTPSQIDTANHFTSIESIAQDALLKADKALISAGKAQSLTVVTNNDYQAIPTDANGDYQTDINGNMLFDCSVSVMAFYGHNDITVEATYTISESSNVTGHWDTNAHRYTVQSLRADTGYVDITAEYNDIEVTKRFNIAKSKAGATGQNARVYYIDTNGIQLLKRGNENVITPEIINATAYYNEGVDQLAIKSIVSFSVIYMFDDGHEEILASEHMTNTNSISVSADAIAYNSPLSYIAIGIFLEPSHKTLLDVVTIPVVDDVSTLEWLSSQFQDATTDSAPGLILLNFIGTRVNERVVAALTDGIKYPFLFAGCQRFGTGDVTKNNSAWVVDDNGNVILQDMLNADSSTRNKVEMNAGTLKYFKGNELIFEQTSTPGQNVSPTADKMLFSQFGESTVRTDSIPLSDARINLLSIVDVSGNNKIDQAVKLASLNVGISYSSLGTKYLSGSSLMTLKYNGTLTSGDINVRLEIRNASGIVVGTTTSKTFSSTNNTVALSNVTNTSGAVTGQCGLYLVITGTYKDTNSPSSPVLRSLSMTVAMGAMFVCENNKISNATYQSRIFGNGVFFCKNSSKYLGLICDDNGGHVEFRSGYGSNDSGFRMSYNGNYRWSPFFIDWVPIDNIIYAGEAGHIGGTVKTINYRTAYGAVQTTYASSRYTLHFPKSLGTTSYIVRLTGSSVTPIYAAVTARTANSISIYTGNDSTHDQGSFFFEIAINPNY